LPKQNKQTGAYSIGGTRGLRKYYVSMNFDKTIRSISTVAHELGHSMHSLYTNKHQTIYTSTSIFYAEIASIVNEALLSYYFLDHYKNDKELCKLILDELIRGFFATTSRQIVFSNFEYEANKLVNESKPFTKEVIKDLYLEMIDKYQGINAIEKSKISKQPYSYGYSTIFRISHFYAGNFYVYKYAIGQIVALLIADKIYHGDKKTINKYFEFLSSGDSKSPIDTIKILGIDLYDKKNYQLVKQIIDKLINQLNKY
jgi:oligoendopeptidase F